MAKATKLENLYYKFDFSEIEDNKIKRTVAITVEAQSEREALKLAVEELKKQGIEEYRYTGKFAISDVVFEPEGDDKEDKNPQ